MCEEMGRRGATWGDVGEVGQRKAREGKARWHGVLGSPTSKYQYHPPPIHVCSRDSPRRSPRMCGIGFTSGCGMQNPKQLMNIICRLLGRQRVCTKPTQSLEATTVPRISPSPSRVPLVASCCLVPRCARSLTFSIQRLPFALWSGYSRSCPCVSLSAKSGRCRHRTIQTHTRIQIWV